MNTLKQFASKLTQQQQMAAAGGATVLSFAMIKAASGSSNSKEQENVGPEDTAVMEELTASLKQDSLPVKPEIQATPKQDSLKIQTTPNVIQAATQVYQSSKLASVSTDKAPSAIGPYSQGIKSGGFLFTSGQIAMKADDGSYDDTASVEEECELALLNLNQVLAAANCTNQDVVKTTVFLQDIQDFEKMNVVYEKYFGQHKPARSAVQVAKLPKGAKVEIEAVARLHTRHLD